MRTAKAEPQRRQDARGAMAESAESQACEAVCTAVRLRLSTRAPPKKDRDARVGCCSAWLLRTTFVAAMSAGDKKEIDYDPRPSYDKKCDGNARRAPRAGCQGVGWIPCSATVCLK
jgi:hypothetical protein